MVLLPGCSTKSHRGGREDYVEVPTNQVKAPIETEHITEAPTLAPPPAGTPPPVHAPINHLANIWIPLRRWSEENKAGPVQSISGGPVPAFALKAPNGLLIVRAYDQVAYWNGLEFHLGFAPQVVNGQPVLDLVILGMGEDGHVASLFPGETEEVIKSEAVYRAVTAVKPPPRRITLGYAAIVAAREVWVIAAGAGKEGALKESFSPRGKTPLARVLGQRAQTRVLTDIPG